MVTNDHRVLCEIDRDQTHHIALTRLIDNHDVKTGHSRIKCLDNPRQRHDPDRDRISGSQQGCDAPQP